MLGFRVQAGRPTFAICDAESIDRPRDSQVAAAAAQDLARVAGIDARVEVAAYDPSWPRSFSAERKRLEALIREAEIHHIGSTAVPGMSAKPVVDIMALVADLDARLGAWSNGAATSSQRLSTRRSMIAAGCAAPPRRSGRTIFTW
jgi:GrpB-like predicted nucleotidyltransferase (UPF0157 family)